MYPLCLLFEKPYVSKMLIQTVKKDVDYSGTCGQNSKIFTELRYTYYVIWLYVYGKVEPEIYFYA